MHSESFHERRTTLEGKGRHGAQPASAFQRSLSVFASPGIPWITS